MTDKVVNGTKTVGIIASVLITTSLVVGATLWLGTHIASLKAVISHHEIEISKLTSFAEKGERFTYLDGIRMDKRVGALEEWTREAPPKWFRDLFTIFKNEMTSEVKDINKSISQLTIDLKSLKLQIEHQEGKKY